MGGSESKGNPHPKSVFSETELSVVHRKHDKLCKSVTLFVDGLSPFDKDASKNLFSYICHLHSEQKKQREPISIKQFETFVGKALKGSFEDKATIFCAMGGTFTNVSKQDVNRLIMSLLSVYKHYVTRAPHWGYIHTADYGIKGDNCFVTHLVSGLSPGEDGMCSSYDIESWMAKSPHMMNIFDTVFSILFQFESAKEIVDNIPAMVPIPRIVGIHKDAIKSVLDVYSVMYLNYNLPSVFQSEWRFLFSNSVYGDSFSQLVSHITNKGPSLIIVKDNSGHIFGGVTSESWECRAKFYGSSSCFLFMLIPHYGIFTSTMYNENFMYLNQGQETLLNGLGMGGQMDYFGLWINHSFNHGHSKAKPKCTTYGSPQLSGEPEFEVDTIEVWALGPDKQKDSDDEGENKKSKKSVLDSDPESKAMLELMGKHQASEGFRERDEENETEEMKKKMNTIPKLL